METFSLLTLKNGDRGSFSHFLDHKRPTRTLRVNPLPPGEGEISLPHSRAIFRKLKNEYKDLFSFRNCKKWCKKAQNAIISISFPSYVNCQPPENRQCIGERASREVAKRGFGSPQAVVYEWIRLSIVLPYADHLFSVTQTLLPHFCSNEAWEMVMCFKTPSGSKLEGVYKLHPALGG